MSLLTWIYYSMVAVVASVYAIALGILANSRSGALKENRAFVPTISLVIPTYNEEGVIGRKLENVVNLDYPREKLRVVVIDSASTDQTREIVDRFVAEHPGQIDVELIRQAVRMGKSHAINEALKRSRSEIFVLTDADVTFSVDSLRKLVQNFGEPQVGAVSGVETPMGKRSFLTRLERDYRNIYTAIRLAEAETDTPFMCESELSAYRRDILDPIPLGSMCDDIELTVGIRRKGYKAIYDLRTTFLENEAGTLRGKLRHKMRRGMANQHSLLRNTRVMFNRAYGRYGTIIFPFEFFVHILSPVLLTVSLLMFLSVAFFSPGELVFAMLFGILAALPAVAIGFLLVRDYRRVDTGNAGGKSSWLLGAVSFMAFQGALMISLLKLAVKGPQLTWEQVPDTRVAIAVQAQAT